MVKLLTADAASKPETEENFGAGTWSPKAYTQQKGVSLETFRKTEHQPERQATTLKYAETNFTVDITITILEPERVKYVPLRAKIDTACSRNIISIDAISRTGIQDDAIETMDQEIVLTGLGEAEHKLKKKIRFMWYLDRGMKSREEDFYIVQDNEFDVILGWSKPDTQHAPEPETAYMLDAPSKSRCK